MSVSGCTRTAARVAPLTGVPYKSYINLIAVRRSPVTQMDHVRQAGRACVPPIQFCSAEEAGWANGDAGPGSGRARARENFGSGLSRPTTPRLPAPSEPLCGPASGRAAAAKVLKRRQRLFELKEIISSI